MQQKLLAWLQSKLAESQRCLISRDQSAETWSGGSDSLWKSIGEQATREQRLEIAATQKRIAEKYRQDVEILEQLIEIVKSCPTL